MKKLFLGLAFVLLTSLLSSVTYADSITLTWDAGYTGADLQGYYIYRADRIGDHTTAWVQIDSVMGDVTTYTDAVDSQNYAYMVTAFTPDKESFPSNMVERYDKTPLPPVQNLRK